MKNIILTKYFKVLANNNRTHISIGSLIVYSLSIYYNEKTVKNSTFYIQCIKLNLINSTVKEIFTLYY